MPSERRRFAGYELGEFLGNGLAGRVHSGRRTADGIEVAIEVITPPLGSDTGFRERLAGEARRASLLDHPTIVAVYEAVSSGEREVALVTAPYRGVPLAATVPKQGIPVAAAALVADAVLLALVQAHRAGLVHGAVEPETVIVDEAGRIRLAGFALGGALPHVVPPERWADIAAVARLTEDVARGAGDVATGSLPRQLRGVLRQDGKRRHQTAGGMRTALAAAARHGIGPDWREQATAELAALYASRGADTEAADLLLDLPPAPSVRAGQAPPEAADDPAAGEPPPEAPAVQPAPPPVLPLAPVIRGVPETRERRTARRVLVAGGLVAACVAVGVVAGLVASAVRDGGAIAGGPLRVGAPVSLRVEPVQGSCNSVFIATATGSLQGQGTLVYRWERSDGLESADTPLSVSASDASFLITQHWQLSGTVSHPAITFRVVSPVRMTVTRQLQYSCP